MGWLNAPGRRYDHLGVTRGKELNGLLVALEAMDLNYAHNKKFDVLYLTRYIL